MRPAAIARAGATGVAAAAGLGGVGLLAVLTGQLAATRRRVLVDPRTAPDIGGTVGDSGPPVRLLVLGDSTAAGVGVTRLEDTVAGRIAAALVRRGRRVELTSVAVPGSHTTDVRMQVSRALVTSEQQPHDVALILVGLVDATSWVAVADVARSLTRATIALRNAGVQVVVGTCLDLGAARCTAFPLRDVWSRRSRRIAAAQAGAASAAGASVVNLAEELGALFRADPGALSTDGFHPSADGYRFIAEALIPPTLSALDFSTTPSG